jgi:hypothetical protein
MYMDRHAGVKALRDYSQPCGPALTGSSVSVKCPQRGAARCDRKCVTTLCQNHTICVKTINPSEHGVQSSCKRARRRMSVLRTLGLWRSWESACLAGGRSRVRSWLAPSAERLSTAGASVMTAARARSVRRGIRRPRGVCCAMCHRRPWRPSGARVLRPRGAHWRRFAQRPGWAVGPGAMGRRRRG